ncbi:angiotensin-converting enzyme-like [Daphnia pulex]|uniref:angiotensin-converting enzyme-like n=1 Tax=Daphnia pulex TaxID=6669 RepID=UPI001EDD5D7E|nr:angiotensin-converting enzyme-like [Daphnia pulex]
MAFLGDDNMLILEKKIFLYWWSVARMRFTAFVVICCCASFNYARHLKTDQLTGEYAVLRSKRSIVEDEALAREYLSAHNVKSSEMCYKTNVAEWRFASDITDENERLKLEQSLVAARFEKEAWKNITSFNWKPFTDPDLKRKFKLLSVLGPSALPEGKLTQYRKTIDAMEKIYSTAKICSFTNPGDCGMNLDPEITEKMSKSRNFDELKHVWQQWHEQSGGKMRHHYEKFVELSNEAARMNNFSDTGAYWLQNYESDTFKEDIEGLWQTIRPFYLQLHAYVRAKLRAHYGEDKVPKNQPIPAHLLGNMWAQSWGNIDDLVTPYPGKTSIDVTPEMLKQGYTPKKMFEMSEEFFTSMGLLPTPPEFWSGSIIEKLVGKEMVCHASAWDFCNGKDFRIKQCTKVTMEDFIVVHHEMGHIQYFLQYKNLPLVYRDGANSGFHEAVGDSLALSVQTTKHLKEIGLLDKSTPQDQEATINYLLATALEKIAFFPFAYIMDKWRWDVFDGSVKSTDYNGHWWKLREKYQGIRSPVTRSENDFDPGAKYHIAANVEYIRYFVSFVIQFQFYKSLCTTAGQYDPHNPSQPLHECDFYRNKEAGAKLGTMLAMGASRPWPEAMRAVTGQDRMDASAFREYFKPLEVWLIAKNKELGEPVGWDSDQ